MRLPAQAAAPIIGTYKRSLLEQAEGRWQRLPDWFIDLFADEYPEISLRQVRYATRINTVHGQAITFAYQIFFPKDIDLNTRSGKHLMLHELEHTAQYQRKGGEQAFISEYLLHGAGRIIQKRSFDVHDDINTEADAISKSDDVISGYGWDFYIHNKCSKNIKIAIRYLDTSGDWNIDGWWTFAADESAYLRSGKTRVHSTDDTYYWYGEVVGSNYKWSGDDSFRFDGRTLDFRKVEVDTTNRERFEIVPACRNLLP
jgi:uncharacterized membrane protein